MNAIRFAIESFKQFLAHQSLLWSTDNYAASLIIERGSSKPHLQKLSEEIYFIIKSLNIKFNIKWTPREYLSFADRLSKQIDYDDWETTGEFFNYISGIWGPFTIDRFADDTNNKTRRFNSKFCCPDTEGVDAFQYSWANENNFLVPPVYLVSRVLRHLEYFKAKGVLVVPYWTSATFYPLIINRNKMFQPFIKEALVFDNWTNCIKQGKNIKCFIGSQNFGSSIV